ncbi:mucin-2-like [Bombus pascuorum]|uniref:mucin-2-like n=1 Tax=Bombus pascuorum TaxID=65598 RepID=UPI00298E3820|nr:mucin-2-like [Bombus pascuorum]
MSISAKANKVRRRRDKQFKAALKHLRESIEESDQPVASHIKSVSALQSQLEYAWQRFQSCQKELDDLDDEDLAQEKQAWKDYAELSSRIHNIASKKQQSTCRMPSNHELDNKSSITATPVTTKLPEIHIPTFDGIMANKTRITALHEDWIDLSEDFKSIRRLLNKYELSGQHNKDVLITYRKLVDDIWRRFNIVFDELLEIDDNEPEDLRDVYIELVTRLNNLNEINSSSTDASNTVANPKPPERCRNTSSSVQRRKNNFNNNSNNVHTPPMEKVVSNLAPIPSHDKRSSLHNKNNNTRSSPTRDLTTKLASSLPERSDSTLPIGLNQTTTQVRSSSPTRDLTTTKFASSLSERSDSTLPIALNQITSNVRRSSPTRDLKTNSHEPLDQKELNPVQDNYGHTSPTENVLSNPVTIPLHDTRNSTHDTRTASPTRDSTTTKYATLLSEQSDSTLANSLNQTTSNTRNSSPTRELRTTSHDPPDRKKLNPVQDNYGHTPPMENILSNPVTIPLHNTRNSTHDTRTASPTRDLTTTTFASSASQQSDSTPPDALNQTILHDRRDREEERISSDDNSAPPLISTNPSQDVSCPITAIHKVENNVLNSVNGTEVYPKSKSTTNSPESTTFDSSRNRFSSSITSTANNLSCITAFATHETNIMPETQSPENNLKTPPSPRPKESTRASDPNRNDILKNNLRESARKLGLFEDFHFQRDNDPKDTDRIVKERIVYNTPHMLITLPQSPDINLIENVWAEIGKR